MADRPVESAHRPLYCIADLGFELLTKRKTDKDVFRFNGKFYVPLAPFSLKETRKIIFDVAKVPIFQLRCREEPDIIFLSLFLDPHADCFSENFNSKRRLIEQFFEVEESVEASPADPQPSTSAAGEATTVQSLYERLRAAHSNDALLPDLPTDLQHPNLRPLLRGYQADAVRWMLHRERAVETIPNEFVRAQSKGYCAEIPFFFHPRTLDLSDCDPGPVVIPPGGLLCDEMGLGKTVEMLSLILFNKREKDVPEGSLITEEDLEVPLREAKKYDLHCTCINAKHRSVVLCPQCNRLQHKNCVLKHASEEMLSNYKCPDCWRNSREMIKASTTLIVSPHSIKMQWVDEIKKHVNDQNFRVFVYDGVQTTGWISPYDLAQYDVVITDYNVLKTEIYFTYTESRTLRYERKRASPVSPLLYVYWWRTVQDEAQMVETPTNQCSKMVKSLPTRHRWAVTGTPIERKIDNLFGLLYFLGYDPFDDYRVWSRLTFRFERGDPAPLVNVLRRVMWRTCKATVLDQIGIPPQDEIIHYVTLSDLQMFFYRTEHANLARLFNEKVRKFGLETRQIVKMNPRWAPLSHFCYPGIS